MRAICTKCGGEYSWKATRGNRLADSPSPCCSAPGKLKERHNNPHASYCPECGKAGLWYRKALMNHELYKTRDVGDFNSQYCPRCKKWIKPIRKRN